MEIVWNSDGIRKYFTIINPLQFQKLHVFNLRETSEIHELKLYLLQQEFWTEKQYSI